MRLIKGRVAAMAMIRGVTLGCFSKFMAIKDEDERTSKMRAR